MSTADHPAELAELADRELDLTNSHLATLGDVELPPSLTVRIAATSHPAAAGVRRAEGRAPSPPPRPLPLPQLLDLTANRLRQLEPKLLALAGLRRLCLRQNLLSNAAEVERLASAPGGLVSGGSAVRLLEYAHAWHPPRARSIGFQTAPGPARCSVGGVGAP
jgi:hypothetical protein